MSDINFAFDFQTAPKIICEAGANQYLNIEAKRLNIKTILCVTDQGLINAGIVMPIVEQLEKEFTVELFTDVQVDPPQEKVEEAIAFARAHKIDGVIAIGGGSSMDTAKVIAVMTNSSQTIEEVYGTDMIRDKRLPLILVPTTAGTGSEVSSIAILTTPTHEKKGIVGSQLLPDVAVLDANNTLGLPPAITAMTGVDAMVHAIESYTSILSKNPVTDALAVKALQLLYNNIDKVIANGKDIQARSAMLLGACLGGITITNAPVGAVHALAYPLGGHFHMPHGHSNAVVLPGVLKYNKPKATQWYAELAHAILPETIGLEAEAAADKFIETMSDLVTRMPFSKSLSDSGVKETDLELLATDAMKVERLLKNNPREMTHDAAYKIYADIL